MDADAVSLAYRWELDGVPQPEVGDVLAAGRARPGQSVQCFATPADDEDVGLELASPVRVVENTAPEVASARISPDPARTTDELTCIAEGVDDADGDPVDLAYAWTLDGLDAGVDTSTLPNDRTARDVTVRCTVTPSDATGPGAPVISAPVVIDNSCLLYTSPSPRDRTRSRMPSSA